MEKEKEKKCPSCGSKIDSGVKFCPYCGAEVKEEAQSNTQPKQSMQQTNGQTQDGQPFVYFNVPPENVNIGANTLASKDKKHTGAFVASIVCFSIGLLFLLFYGLLYGQMIASISSGDGWAFFAFFLYLVTFGWISIIPALALNIASLSCAIVCLKSTSKTYKVFGIIIMALSIIALVALLVSIILPQLGIFNS